MPQFDPNAAPSSLAYTMPSWEGTIKRIRNETDFQIVSEDVKNKLAFQNPAIAEYTCHTIKENGGYQK